ncbi:MAG TPA: OmpA family protein [Candidatus Binatia bacterium]
MRRGLLLGLSAMAIGMCLMSTVPARADGPEIGVDVGAAIPLDKYKRTVSKDVGGTVGFWSGYRFDLTDNFAISLIGQPQFTFFDTQHGCCKDDSGMASLFSITGGPKFSLITGPVETYIQGLGGYYRDMSGPMSDDGVGFNTGGGVNFFVADNTTVGLFGNYNYMNLVAAPHSDVARQMVLAGFAVQHVFEEAPPPPPKVAPPPPPAPPPPRPSRKIVLRGVNFDFNKSNIRNDARPILDEAVRTLHEERDINVSVEGHTDSVGSDAYNQKLSERRGHSVASYLERGGISHSRLTVEGFGESRPVATNATDDGRAQNRRVELHIIGQ